MLGVHKAARRLASRQLVWHAMALLGASAAGHCSFLLPTTLQEPLHPPFDGASFRPALECERPARQFLDCAAHPVPSGVSSPETMLGVALDAPGPAFHLLLYAQWPVLIMGLTGAPVAGSARTNNSIMACGMGKSSLLLLLKQPQHKLNQRAPGNRAFYGVQRPPESLFWPF